MRDKDKLITAMLSIARILFGITFLFSGFVKAVDPIGFAYKIEDYLISFQLLWLLPFALAFAIGLIVLELMLGVFVLLGNYRKLSTSLSVMFMAVMMPMTLYIALKNPVEDCGCFGDALVISNWATFYKNVVLIVLALILLIFHKKIKPLFSYHTQGYVLGFVFAFSLLFSLYNTFYLPIMDFRPYKVGVNIPKQMEEDLSKGDLYETIYVFEKEGVEQEFSEDSAPWEDSTWNYVDHTLKLVKEGEQPQIEDFFMIAYTKDASGNLAAGEDITDKLLAKPFTLLAVSLSLNDARKEGMEQLISLASHVADKNIELNIATSSDAHSIEQWHAEWKSPDVNYVQMDELTLKTIVRSNPGLLLLNNGTIAGKWGSRNLPSKDKLSQLIVQRETKEERMINNKSSLNLLVICALFVIPLLGIKWYDNKWIVNK